MREFEKYGHSWLVEALKDSTKVEVDEKGDNVRRTGPLVERPRESVEEKSVYAVCLPCSSDALLFTFLRRVKYPSSHKPFSAEKLSR
jgi:hypothetical protein